jgi:hypothetical protein
MSSLQISSLLSGDLSEYIRRNLAVAHGLASAFQRLPPALDQLRTTLVDPNGDVTVHQQYRSLCRNLREVGSEALAFVDLLESVLSLRGDRERWGRIDSELLTASEADLNASDVQSYPHLLGFVEEMQIRMEGLGRVRDKLRSNSQSVDAGRRELLVETGHGSMDLMLTGVRIVKNAALGGFAFGTVIYLLGFSGISSRMIYFRHKLGFTFLACLGLVYKFLCSKQASLETKKMRESEAISATNDIIDRICRLAETPTLEATQESVPLPQIRQCAESFFKTDGEEDHKLLQTSKSELREAMNSM